VGLAQAWLGAARRHNHYTINDSYYAPMAWARSVVVQLRISPASARLYSRMMQPDNRKDTCYV